MTARAVSDHVVEFTVLTNLPPPLEVMASVDPTGQKPTDTYIGYSEKVSISGRTTIFRVDTSKASMPLPATTYDVSVAFYPNWGAKNNPVAQRAPELEARTTLELRGSGQTKASVVGRDIKRLWVIENVVVGTRWREGEFVRRLGRFEKAPSTLSSLHSAYYFPKADMTLIVNESRHDVAIWRMGNATE